MSDNTTEAAEEGQRADLTKAASYLSREELQKSCDLIMKGGITSGIIYPHVACELARTHRIVNVGGTSAGAIAAAGAAAAEVGRDRGGYVQLAKLPMSLIEPPQGSKHTQLFHLFQAQPSTRALYRFLAVFISRGGVLSKVMKAAVSGLRLVLPLPFVICLVLPLVALAGAIIQGDWVGTVLAALLVALGLVTAVVWSMVRRLLRDLPGNHLGLCSGMGGAGHDEALPLTEWLANTYDRMAGNVDADDNPTEPLTFGQLRRAGVDLAMFTTNLTLATQNRVPFTTRIWAFRPDEFRDLFPERVVRWMVDHPPEPRPGTGDAEVYQRFAQGSLAPLPDENDLPVIVGVRMSLSFPVLLSTVPLHAIDYTSRKQEAIMHRFSDGGITSNFPLQFFDQAIPARPTFAINLRSTERLGSDPADNVSMPKKNASGILARPTSIGSVGELLGSIKNSMQNWADAMQTHVPGYRDRIVAVEHLKSEGGMNLDMNPAVVRALIERGRCAGVAANGFDMVNHRWVRFRSFLQLLEDLVIPAADGLRSPPPGGMPTYGQMIDDPPSYKSPKLGPSGHRIAAAIETLADAFANERSPGGESPFEQGAPSPAPELKIKPRP